MIRKGMVTIALIIAFQGLCYGQGILDSVFGPGGLGLWGGGDATGQYGNPQYYSGVQDPSQQYYQQQGMPGQQPMPYPPAGAPGYPQGYPPQGYAPPQGQAYYPQQGVYADWQNYPATPAPAPPVQYSAPQQPMPQQPAPQQYAPQQYAPQQYAPQQYAAPPTQAGPPQGVAGAPPLRPGQYTPGPGPGPVSAEDLPAGAVRITTTTPDGTTVQYYPPAGETEPGQSAVRAQPRPRPAAAKPARTKQAQPREQRTGGDESSGVSAIAMPKPVEIPQGQDPRSGWGAAVNRAPSGSSTR